MYDNSASLALAGSGITILGQSAGLAVLTVFGLLFLALGVTFSLRGRSHRDKGAA